MLRIFFCSIALLVLGVPTAFAAECSLKQIASIPAKLSPHNQLLVEAAINDQPVTIQIDTGAAVSVLSRRFAVRIGMSISDTASTVYGLSGRALNESASLHSLRLGRLVSTGDTLALTPAGGDGTDGEPVALFGADYLQNYDVEIDVAGGKVNLFSQDHCPDRVVYWAPEFFKSKIYYVGDSMFHRPTMDISVDGRSLRAVIDTGAYATVMRQVVAEDRFGLSPDTPDMPKVERTGGVEGGTLDTYQHTFQSLIFGDITLHNTPMMIVPINVGARTTVNGSHINQMAAEQPDVLIGMSLLKHLHLFLSYSEGALYYTIAAAKPGGTP